LNVLAISVIQQGLDTPAHAAFINRLVKIQLGGANQVDRRLASQDVKSR
jgi:hypothetical protein